MGLGGGAGGGATVLHGGASMPLPSYLALLCLLWNGMGWDEIDKTRQDKTRRKNLALILSFPLHGSSLFAPTSRSLELDTSCWSEDVLKRMKTVGNAKSNRVMEAKLPTEWIRISEVGRVRECLLGS